MCKRVVEIRLLLERYILENPKHSLFGIAWQKPYAASVKIVKTDATRVRLAAHPGRCGDSVPSPHGKGSRVALPLAVCMQLPMYH